MPAGVEAYVFQLPTVAGDADDVVGLQHNNIHAAPCSMRGSIHACCLQHAWGIHMQNTCYMHTAYTQHACRIHVACMMHHA